ncbi:MAG: hypothetical protein LBK56_06960 [Gracilibacteraceae bacterium]|jgi:hypothetical protein|nr:hypothetical protein [Gracilibacteraceae bacterium]
MQKSLHAKLLPGYLAVLVFSFLLYFIMVAAEKSLLAHPVLFDFNTWLAAAASEPLYRFLWLIGDITEPQYYKSVIGGVLTMVFALTAWLLQRAGNKLGGNVMCGSVKTWPWLVFASFLALFISVYLYGDNLDKGAWIPTFVPFVSIPGAVVLVYGPSLKNALTGGIIGGLVTFPISYWTIEWLWKPLELHVVLGNVAGMWIGGILVLELCRVLPWMKLPPPAAPVGVDEKAFLNKAGVFWFVRRTLADFTESHYYANELASIGMIAGTLLSWALNPAHPGYGSGLFPAILCSQFLTAATGIFLFANEYKTQGWFPTFTPIVSVAPAIVLTFGGTMQSILFGALIGALFTPVVAALINRSIPPHWSGMIGCTCSMMICSGIAIMLLKYTPGFGLPWFF